MLWSVAGVAVFCHFLHRTDPPHLHASIVVSGTLSSLFLLNCYIVGCREHPLLKDSALEPVWTLMVLGVALVSINFLVDAHALILSFLKILVHKVPRLWGAFGHAHHCLVRSEANLILEVVLQLIVRNGLISRRIHSADQCQGLPVRQIDSITLKEKPEIDLVDFAVVITIHAPEHGQWRVVGSPFQVVCHLLQLFENMQLLHKDVDKVHFVLHWQFFVPRDSDEWSVTRLQPQSHILAWQNNLQKVLIAKESIALRIIEVDQLLAVTFCEQEHVVLSKEADDITAVQPLLCGSIKTHECAVGWELFVNGAKCLTKVLWLEFSFHYLQHHIPKYPFSVYWQHFQIKK